MSTFLNDIKYGLRILARNPGFSLVVILALGLGIGATSTVFSIVNSVLLRPLPIEEPDRVVMLWENERSRGHEEVELSFPNFIDWRERNRVFEDVVLLTSVNIDMTILGGDEPEQVEGVPVSAGFFSLLGVDAALGRTFQWKDEKPSEESPVVISDGLWKRRYGARRDIIGTKVLIEGTTATVIGVMPREFDFPKGAQLWVPFIIASADDMPDRGMRAFRAIARLKPGVTMEQARADMNRVTLDLARAYPKENEGFGATIQPLVEKIFGNARPALFVLLGAVALVLLIACVNVANLLLARAGERRREIAVRLALGAGRLRLVRQLLTESLLLATLGGAIGILIALYGVEILTALAPRDIPRITLVTVDTEVVAFTVIVSFLTAIIFGLAPALQATHPDLNESLKDTGARTLGSAGAGRLRSMLVVAEVALAVVLMIGAGLLLRSFNEMQSIDPGFRTERIFTARLALQRPKYNSSDHYKAFYKQLLERVENLPGVESAAAVLMRPLSGTVGWDFPYTVEGQGPQDHLANPYSNYEAISPNYFRTMGITIVKGRDFEARDENGERVAIINETMAHRYWPGREAIGGRIKFGPPESKAPWMTVVGVVKDVRYREWDSARIDIYVPYLQKSEFRSDFVVRTSIDPITLAESFRREVYAIDKDQAVAGITTMEEIVDTALARPRFNTLLLVIFAAFALILAVLGVYGVMAYSVSRRTHEIGLRMALGARRSNLLGMLLRQGAILITLGVMIGVAGAFLVTRIVSSLLFGIGAADPITYIAVTLLLAAVALLACYIPARRAMRIDPMAALRHE